MLAQELDLIDLCREEHKGDTMVQISGSDRGLLGRPSRKRQKIIVRSSSPKKANTDQDKTEQAEYSQLQCDLDRIPLETGSVDFMVLQHVLEFSPNPHSVLREATRVLAPQGNLVLICFNPYSLFGLRKSLQLALFTTIPWAHHGLSCRRVSDWLHLMSCEPINTANGFYAFPVQWRWLLKKMGAFDRWLTRWGVPGGGFYVIHACKEVITPIKHTQVRPAPQLVKFPATVSAANAEMKKTKITESKSD